MIDQVFQKMIKQLKLLPAFVNKYRYPIGGALVLVIFSITIYRIDTLSSPEVNQDRYNAGILEQEKVVFDEEVVERINQLDERTVNPSGNIDESRNNPF